MAIDQRNLNPKIHEAPKQIADNLRETAETGQRALAAMPDTLKGVTDAGSVWVQGSQKISSEWLDLAQSRFKMNLDAANKLMACKTPQDFVALQSDIVRQNMEHMMDNFRRIAEISLGVANEAAGKLKTTPRENAEHIRQDA